MEKQGTDYQFT